MLPLVSPVTEIGLFDPLTAVAAPAPIRHEAVYTEIVAPPFDAGAVNATEIDPLPVVATPIVGASGTVAGVTLTAAEAALLPAAFVAMTVHA